jgi:glucose 1-dehydrogenase
MTDWLELKGRVCVVTGAASGIGAQIAMSLAEAGAKLALLDRDIDMARKVLATITGNGGHAMAFECDVSDESSVMQAAAAVQAGLGAPWGLVNNAGFLRSASLSEVSLADWNAVLAVNLTGYLLVGRTFARQMQGRGSVVNVASIAANFPQSHSGAYSASKAGVVQMSRQMAVEWGAQGIRCNVICPGLIRTALSAAFYAVPGVEAKRAAMTASKRVGEPADIANTALFLLSPRSEYVNATEIDVDGGMPAMLMDMVPRPGYNC